MKKITNGRRVCVSCNAGVVMARRAAEEILALIEDEPARKSHLVPSFVSALCMGIEGEINDMLLEHFFSKVGSRYKETVQPLLMLRLRDRFCLGVLVASEYRYALNEENPKVKALYRLFELRNRYVHVKQHRKIATVSEDGYISWLFDHPDTTDPYGPEQSWKVNLAELRRSLRLFNHLIPRLYSLVSRMCRRNFNPGELFIPVAHELEPDRKRQSRTS